MNNRILQFALAALALVFVLSTVNSGNEARTGFGTTSYSQFLEDVKNNRVREVTIDGQEIRASVSMAHAFEPSAPTTRAWSATWSTTA